MSGALLTIDLEDYHWQYRRKHGESDPEISPHLSDDVARLTDFMQKKNIRATFFATGYLGRKHSTMIRRVAELGHEIACHSLYHDLIFRQSRTEFHAQTLEAKAILEDACGKEVVGFRAPEFSVSPDLTWFFEELIELGFQYDASLRCRTLENFGKAWPFLVSTHQGEIWEFPLRSMGFGRKRLTLIGGTYLRLLPQRVSKYLLGLGSPHQFKPMLYIHPYDAEYPPVPLPSVRQDGWRKVKDHLGQRLREWGRAGALQKIAFLCDDVLSDHRLGIRIPQTCPRAVSQDVVYAAF